MKLAPFSLALLALGLGTSILLVAQDRGGWDMPPQEFRDIQRQGFHDGLEAAHYDFDHQLPQNVQGRREFLNPPVPREGREDYRIGFHRGYDAAFGHYREAAAPHQSIGSQILQAVEQGLPQDHPDHDRGGWDMPPQEFRDIQRQGFHDGIEAARRDFDHQFPPNIEASREFREPPVPREAREDYREGFRRGYDSAFAHFREGHDRY
ncbi:MAG: hypothetical protein ABSF70_14410 [Terracidiphilus sp.]|jgi:hypothetical protein